MTDRYPNAGKLWSAEEEHQLREMFTQGQSLKEMCDQLGRSSAGVVARLVKLSMLDQLQADALTQTNWSCIPRSLAAKMAVCATEAVPRKPPVLLTPVQHNAVAADPVGFNNFLSWVRQIGNQGCKPEVSGELGRFFSCDRYLSVSDVCYQLQQVPVRLHHQTKAHRFVFSFGDSTIDSQTFLTLLWKRCWKEKWLRPFHWYGVHHKYPSNFHMHVLIEGVDWDWHEVQFADSDLRRIESVARDIIAKHFLE